MIYKYSSDQMWVKKHNIHLLTMLAEQLSGRQRQSDGPMVRHFGTDWNFMVIRTKPDQMTLVMVYF